MLIVIGSFFMINLCLVVIATQFRCFVHDNKLMVCKLWSCSFQWDKAARDGEDESWKSQVQLLLHPLLIHKRVTTLILQIRGRWKWIKLDFHFWEPSMSTLSAYEKHFKSAKLPWHHNFNTFVGHDFTHGLGMVWVKVFVRVLVSEW